MTDAPATKQVAASSRFPCIDGLRALAALAVFGFHSGTILSNQDREFLPLGALNWISRLGFFGVALFFIISGFLLYRPFAIAALSDRPAPRWAPFWKRRFFRIFPAYWLALAGAAFLLSQVHFGSVPHAFVLLGLARSYQHGPGPVGLGVAWTLEIEVSFYLILPLLAALIRRVSNRSSDPQLRARAQIATLIAMGAAAVALRLWFFFDARFDPTPRGTWFGMVILPRLLPMYLDWFAAGMALAVGSAWLSLGGQVPRVVAMFGKLPAVSWLVAFECYWVVTQLGFELSWIARPISATQTCLNWAFTGIAAAFFVLPAVFGTQSHGGVRRFLTSRALVMTAIISYGIYLWHLPVWIEMAQWRPRGMPMLLQVGIVFAVTVTIAVLSWQIVERPLIRLSGGNAPRLLARPKKPAPDHTQPLEPVQDRERTSASIAAAVAGIVVLIAVIGLAVGSRNLNNLTVVGALDGHSWPGQHAVVWDNFDRRDQAGLGIAVTGQRWQSLSGAWSIGGGRATARTTGSVIVPVRATHVRAIGGGVAFRCRDAKNCWWILPVPRRYSTWIVQKIVDGKVTTVGDLGFARIDAAVSLAVHSEGNRIVIAVDGVVSKIIFDPDLAGAPGVGLIHGSGTALKTWDQFEASP